MNNDKLLNEIEELQNGFLDTIVKLKKDIKRNDRVIEIADKQQLRELKKLEEKLEEIKKLQKAQRELFDAFIKMIANTIDIKSKHTAQHCQRVPELSNMIADAIQTSNKDIFNNYTIDEEQIRQISMAAWLHDCGKLTTPDHIVDKATKLETIYNRIHEIRTRFEVIYRDYKIEALEKKLAGEDSTEVDKWLEKQYKLLEDEFTTIAEANIGKEFMDSTEKEKIQQIAKRTWRRYFNNKLGLSYEELQRIEDDDTTDIEYLLSDKQSHLIKTTNIDKEQYEKLGFKVDIPKYSYNLGEIYNLSIEYGTLSYEERFKINEHVHSTIMMLDQLPFPNHLKDVPLYAGAHHETLDGTGYPRKLTKSQIPLPARIIAIADIFEALTASNRPYKKPNSLSESLEIMASLVNKKHIDKDIFIVFLESHIYLNYAKLYLKEEQIDEIDIKYYINLVEKKADN